METTSFVGFKTLVVFFSLFFYRANHNNEPNKKVIGNPKFSSVAECLVVKLVKLANKGFAYTPRKPNLLLVYLLTYFGIHSLL